MSWHQALGSFALLTLSGALVVAWKRRDGWVVAGSLLGLAVVGCGLATGSAG